jgi:ABC-type lipoprotein release transport system permease subunit
MNFNLFAINQNRGLYISTTIVLFVLSFLFLLGRGISFQYNENLHTYNSFREKSSIQIERIDQQPLSQENVTFVEQTLGEYDPLIKKSFYRIDFSGIAKFQALDTEFRGFGIDLKRDNETLQKYIEIERGENLNSKSQNSIIISSSIADRLKVDINESIELYLLNRNAEDGGNDIMNIALIKVDGIFKQPFSDKNIIFFPTRLAESILKSSNIDFIEVEFYLQSDIYRVNQELAEKLEKEGLAFKILEITESKTLYKISILATIFIILIVGTLSYRDNLLLIEKRRKIFSTLLNYGWKKRELVIFSFNELLIINGISFLITLFLLYLVFAINIPYPSLFNNYNIPLEISFEFSEILFVSAGMTLLNMGFSAIWITLFSKFRRE